MVSSMHAGLSSLDSEYEQYIKANPKEFTESSSTMKGKLLLAVRLR